MMVEEALLAVLDEVAREVRRLHGGPSREGTAADRRLAREVSALLSREFRDRLTLKQLAETFGYSPFHLCRVFRARTGTTIHRYLSQIRLRTALDDIAAGHDDLARLGAELGYSSHSHFTQSFRRTFRIPPSWVRRLRSSAQLKDMRKILTG
jgi:AraC-like DNA-binding protein